MTEPNNTIGIRAVRAKNWDWWFIELAGNNAQSIATGTLIGDTLYLNLGIPLELYTSPKGKRPNLIRRLCRMLGVKSINWEVQE